MKLSRFAIFAWGVLAYNLFVIVWGAFVRATGSGAGCGSHWPLCNGEVIPRAPQIETLIEFSHRITSGLALFAVLGMVIWAWRRYAPGHPVRLGALLSLIFIIIEALVGAGLVLLEYVAHSVSLARAYWMAGHLINTFILVGVLTLTAWWASGGARLRLRGQGTVLGALLIALVAMLILGASGGITALGDTLVYSAGITPEQSPLVATLVDLRIYHPLLAFVVGGLVGLALWQATSRRPHPRVTLWAFVTAGFYLVQLGVGAANVYLQAPVAMQMIHLLISDFIWIALVLTGAEALSADRQPVIVATSPERVAA
ncbi:MAG: COX15/CtaA family protein [Litorilinea sp.]